MKQLISILATLPIWLGVMGCATIARGPDQNISISSNPTGAYVTVNHQYYGVTPIVVTLNRRKNYNVGIELEGYIPASVAIASQQDMAVAGNCLFGGLPGVAIDAMSGAAYVLKPDTIHMNLIYAGPGNSNIRPPPRPQFTPPQRYPVQKQPTREVPVPGDADRVVAVAVVVVVGFILSVILIETYQ